MPIRTDRIVPVEGSGWPEGDELVAQFLADCRAPDALAALAALEDRIRTMPIASRFSTTRLPQQGMAPGTEADLPEAEYKRQALLRQLVLVRGRLITAFDIAASLLLDVEATGREI